jgi:hypothetical protein
VVISSFASAARNFGSQFGQFQHALNMTRANPSKSPICAGFSCSASVNPAICSDGCIAICCSFSAIDATASSSGTLFHHHLISGIDTVSSAGAAALWATTTGSHTTATIREVMHDQILQQASG